MTHYTVFEFPSGELAQHLGKLATVHEGFYDIGHVKPKAH